MNEDTVLLDYHNFIVEKLRGEGQRYRDLLDQWVKGAIIPDIGCRHCGEPVQDEPEPEVSPAHSPDCLVAKTCARLRGIDWPPLLGTQPRKINEYA